MHTYFDASAERWQICVEDSKDPALRDFAFPDEAYEWLQSPEVYLNRLTAVQELFPSFMNRLWEFVAQGQVQVGCLAKNICQGRPQPVLPGYGHVAILGPEGFKDPFGKGSVRAVVFPLVPPDEAPPSWEAFPLVSPELRAACEQLAGLAFGGLYCSSIPVILPWTAWPKWQQIFPHSGLGDSSVNPEPELQATDAKLWVLQYNYCSVVTLLRTPGYLVQVQWAKGDKVRILQRLTLQDFLAAELERGIPSQNPGFVDKTSLAPPRENNPSPLFPEQFWLLLLAIGLLLLYRACGD